MAIQLLFFVLGLFAQIAGAKLWMRGASKLSVACACVRLAVAAACAPVSFAGRQIARRQDAVFVGCCVARVACLIVAAQRHARLTAFNEAMAVCAIALAVVGPVVARVRAAARRSK